MFMSLVEKITEFDFAILNFIYENIRCDFLDPIMRALSHFADKGIGWIIVGVILIFPKKTRKWGIMALVAMLIGFVFGELVLKNLIGRVRPYGDYHNYFGTSVPFALNAGTESSSGFPSGHTCCSFASAFVYFKADKRWGIAALVLAGLIGFSRLYNYVHYPTDVLGGMVLGIASGLLTIFIYKKYFEDNFAVKNRLSVEPPQGE